MVAVDLRSIRANTWAFVPAALLASLIALQLFLVKNAVSDPSFAVEDDYYAKAVSWSEKMAQDRENTRLGFGVNVDVEPAPGDRSEVRIRIVSRDGAPVTGATVKARAFYIARANRPVAAVFVESAPGVYRASLSMRHPGLWEIRFTAERGVERFTHVVRRDIVLDERRR